MLIRIVNFQGSVILSSRARYYSFGILNSVVLKFVLVLFSKVGVYIYSAVALINVSFNYFYSGVRCVSR